MLKRENKSAVVDALAGLYLDGNTRTRPLGTFRVLNGWDQATPGMLRKVRGPSLYNANAYDSVVRHIQTYRRTAADDPRVLVITNQSIYDLDTGGLLASLVDANDRYPFVACLPGRYNDDTVTYVYVTREADPPRKWSGVEGEAASPVGVSAPTQGVAITRMVLGGDQTLNDPQLGGFPYPSQGAGVPILTQRAYRWTYFNPTTKHESSPSDTPNSAVISPDLQPNLYTPNTALAAMYNRFLSIMMAVPTTAPGYGDGYTRKRLYCTHDGGSEYFLCRDVVSYDEGAGTFHAPDADGSFPLSDRVVLDGMPAWNPPVVSTIGYPVYLGYFNPQTVPGVQDSFLLIVPRFPIDFLEHVYQLGVYDASFISAVGPQAVGTWYTQWVGGSVTPGSGVTPVAPVADVQLVDIGPDIGENDPPPTASWGAVFQNRLWLVDTNAPARLWFSQLGRFEDFGSDSFIDFPADNLDPIHSLQAEFMSLLIGKHNSLHRLTGSNFTDFSVVPVTTNSGTLGRRVVDAFKGNVVYLSRQGLMVLAADTEQYVGEIVHPLTDVITHDDAHERLQIAVDANRSLVLLVIPVDADNDAILVMDTKRKSPFSLIQIGGQVTALCCVELADSSVVVLAGVAGFSTPYSFQVIQLDLGQSPLTATAETNALPPEELPMRKNFTRLRVFGDGPPLTQIDGITYQCSVDGGAFVPAAPRPLKLDNPLGVVGKSLVIRFFQGSEVDLTGDDPLLPGFQVEYTSMGNSA